MMNKPPVHQEQVTADNSLIVQSADGVCQVDFGRPLEAMFGMPFDAIDLEAAVEHLRRCARERRPCFLSTPNVNFAVAAQTDAAFRASVLRSDLSLIDGMPLVWAARLLGLPLRQRVAGSDVFARLRLSEGEPLKVYFFGGPPGVAERAGAVLNAEGGGLCCVGHASPGFGSVEDLSRRSLIEHINSSGADFVVISLGAKKGQAWIERNRERLAPPIVSHLGAVVNFVAGGVDRAPPWLQRLGFEWLWRIKEEPELWRRYAADGLSLFHLLFSRLLPALRDQVISAPHGGEKSRLALRQEGRSAILSLHGVWHRGTLTPLRWQIVKLLRDGSSVQVDLTRAVHIDAAVIAVLMQLQICQSRPPALLRDATLTPAVRRTLHQCCADFLFE